MKTSQQHRSFKLHDIAKSFPETAATFLLDEYLTDEPEASARVFRVYRGTPPHYHSLSDEYLYVFSGRGTFWMGDAASLEEFAPGDLLFFKKGTMHALPEILQGPLVFLSFDVPRRNPKDIVFLNPEDGSPESFIHQVEP
jgi:mannose-6-phosphate isomerase-like protein (cupin superfamily)